MMPSDSWQLAALRERFHTNRPGCRATPRALGRYAAGRGDVITDFGAHSKRWRRMFEEGAASE